MRRARRQAGFTIVELMISLLISTLLVIMILSIFSRLSFAYREQQQIVSVQQLLSAARGAIELDAKQAGLELSQGFKISSDGAGATNLMHSAVRVINSSTGPDQIGFYYADPTRQAVVKSSGPPTTITVDSSAGFLANDVVVLSTPDTTSFSNPIAPTTDAKIAKFDACIVQIQTVVSATSVTFFTSGVWGRANNDHCGNTINGTTMMYPFVARYWRIDPTRPGQGVLQVEANGNLLAATSWQDQAYGFTDLQVATYIYDADGIDTADPDTDPDRDWYSSAAQKTMTDPILKTNNFLPPIMMTISLVARTDRDVEGVFTTLSPPLVGADVNYNTIGDHASVALPSLTDTTLMGNRIYRFLTFQVDLRNMGVGR